MITVTFNGYVIVGCFNVVMAVLAVTAAWNFLYDEEYGGAALSAGLAVLCGVSALLLFTAQ